MDSLTEGLSNLTPTSPTTAGPPPVFPLLLTDVPHSEHIAMNGLQSHAPTLLSQSAPSTLCHIRTDHAYQVIRTRHTARHWRCRKPADKRRAASRDETSGRRLVSAAENFTVSSCEICRGSCCDQCDKKILGGQFELLNSHISVGVYVRERKGKKQLSCKY